MLGWWGEACAADAAKALSSARARLSPAGLPAGMTVKLAERPPPTPAPLAATAAAAAAACIFCVAEAAGFAGPTVARVDAPDWLQAQGAITDMLNSVHFHDGFYVIGHLSLAVLVPAAPQLHCQRHIRISSCSRRSCQVGGGARTWTPRWSAVW